MKSAWVSIFLVCLLTCHVGAAVKKTAKGSDPFIDYLFPAGGQRGTTVQVTASGRNLGQVTGVRVSGTGVSAKLVKVENATTVVLTMTVAPGAVLGERDVRLITPDGFTNRFRFFVGQIPEVLEKEPNDDFEHAQRLESLPVLINGQIMEGDRDFFRFAARKGQTLVFVAQGRAILPLMGDAVPGWNDVLLTLYDANGREIQTVDDFRLHPDPVMFFTPPTDGEYVLEARDTIFRGREDFVYRLSIGALPFITDIFPIGAPRGTTAHLAIHGVNLPSGSLDLKLTEDCPPVKYVGVARYGVCSNQLPFAVSDVKEICEKEPNDSIAAAQPVEVPIAIDGRVDHSGDVDCFTFQANTGQKLVMDVQARRLESPLDAILTLLDDQGRKLAQVDDTVDPEWPMLTHHADPKLSFTFSKTGKYTLRLRGVQGKGGPEYAYHLVIAPPKPDFALRVTPDHAGLGKGDSAVLTVSAIRKDGFIGAIDVAVDGLPEGYVAKPATIAAGQEKTVLTVTAPTDAKPGTVLKPTVKGTARILIGSTNPPGREVVTHTALPAETLMQAFAYTQVLPTQELLISVTQSQTFILAWALAPAKVGEVPRGGQVELKVKVTREQGVVGPVGLKAVGLPGGIIVKYVSVEPDKNEATLTIAAQPRAAVGLKTNVIVTGTLKGVTRTLPAVPVVVVPRQ